MEQNEEKWRKMKTLDVRRFGKIWMIFDDFLENEQFLSKFDDFWEIYGNAQNPLKMRGRFRKNEAQNPNGHQRTDR